MPSRAPHTIRWLVLLVALATCRPEGPERSEPEPGPLFPVVTSAKWGFVDRTGTAVIPPRFISAVTFSGGLARVRVGYSLGYIDRTGRFVWGPTW